MNAFARIIGRDLRLAQRHGLDNLMVVAFFVIAVVLFPFGIGPAPNVMARIGAGILLVAALLASLLSLERLFQADYEDGSLDLLVLTPAPLEVVVLAKVTAHWMTTGLPLIVAAPLLGVLVNLPAGGYPTLLLALLLGTPTLSLIGAVGAALVLGARRGGVLLSLLVLPLFIPVLVFAADAVGAAIGDFGARGQLMILGALLLAATALCPLAAAAALRQAVR
jgi:heme exporter protein B